MNINPTELNPDSVVLRQMDGQWQKFAMFLLFKLAGREQVRLHADDMRKCLDEFEPGMPVLYTHGHKDSIDFQVVDEAAAASLVAHDRTMRGHA